MKRERIKRPRCGFRRQLHAGIQTSKHPANLGLKYLPGNMASRLRFSIVLLAFVTLSEHTLADLSPSLDPGSDSEMAHMEGISSSRDSRGKPPCLPVLNSIPMDSYAFFSSQCFLFSSSTQISRSLQTLNAPLRVETVTA